jgi:hypothetical protein
MCKHLPEGLTFSEVWPDYRETEPRQAHTGENMAKTTVTYKGVPLAVELFPRRGYGGPVFEEDPNAIPWRQLRQPVLQVPKRRGRLNAKHN